MIKSYTSNQKCDSCHSEVSVKEFDCIVGNSIEACFHLCRDCRLKLEEEIQSIDHFEEWVRGWEGEKE